MAPGGRRAQTNALAIAALVCGLAQPFTGMLTTIPAVVARSHLPRTDPANW